MITTLIGIQSFVLFVLYTILGAVLFFNPEWAATQFAWKISPFVAMTIGGWCIGSAFFSWKSFKALDWKKVYPNLIFLWIFGIMEALVLLKFLDKLLLNSPLAILYTGTLIFNCLFSVFGIYLLVKNGIPVKTGNIEKPIWLKNGVIVAIILVAGIAIGALTAPNGGAVTKGQFLPEKLSLFTIRAFGAFYLSLVLTGLTLLKNKSVAPVIAFAEGGLALTIPITTASLIYFRGFNLWNYPGGLIYIVAYIIVVIAVVPILYYFYPKLKA